MSKRLAARERKAATPEQDAPEQASSPEDWFRDLAGALGWNPLVGADLRPMVESCARTADAWATANRIALGAALAVAECQFRILRQVVEEGISSQRDLFRGGDAVDVLPEQAWRVVRGFDGLLEDLRDLGATVARSQVEIADTLNRRLAKLGDEVEQYVFRLKQ